MCPARNRKVLRSNHHSIDPYAWQYQYYLPFYGYCVLPKCWWLLGAGCMIEVGNYMTGLHSLHTYQGLLKNFSSFLAMSWQIKWLFIVDICHIISADGRFDEECQCIPKNNCVSFRLTLRLELTLSMPFTSSVLGQKQLQSSIHHLQIIKIYCSPFIPQILWLQICVVVRILTVSNKITAAVNDK